MPLATNKLIPTGGVTKPIARLTTIITPKWVGSTPTFNTIGKKIGVIDSQDALIGNPSYDLVSLIDDVRIKTPRKLKKQIYNYYLKKTLSSHRDNSKKFMEDFNILSVQRSLKIIGIFQGFLKETKKIDT